MEVISYKQAHDMCNSVGKSPLLFANILNLGAIDKAIESINPPASPKAPASAPKDPVFGTASQSLRPCPLLWPFQSGLL